MQQTVRYTSHANGKLLLTAEYFVLDGAMALAVPVNKGQSFEVYPSSNPWLSWKSKSEKECWFEGNFTAGEYTEGTSDDIGNTLSLIFKTINTLRPDFSDQLKFLHIETNLDFPRTWGLGSSSTLLYNLATWAGVDAYTLQFDVFGGSGYDIACAGVRQPILYKKVSVPEVQKVSYQPSFLDHLYFLPLNKKQDTRLGIARYKERVKDNTKAIQKATELTYAVLEATNITTLEALIVEHETLVANILELDRAKDLYFPDYWGEVKSLGAWGGDFVLVTSTRDRSDTEKYFEARGYSFLYPYASFVMNERD